MTEYFNITDLFYQAARETPQRSAIKYREQVTSFQDLEQSVTKTAVYFLRKGVRKGDRVLVFVPMGTDLYRVVLAIFKIGATAVFLDEWVSVGRLSACCKLADCHAFVGNFKTGILAWLIPALRSIPLHLGLHYNEVGEAIVFPQTTSDEVALITFTTGSTGVPKAAIRTHQLLHEQFKALLPLVNPGEGDTCLTLLPIVLLINLGAGITSVITDFKWTKPGSLHPEKIIDQIKNQQVSTIIASPYFIKEIADYLVRSGMELPEIVKICTGGGPVFAHEAMLYQRAFPRAHIKIVYGSTEAEPISFVGAQQLQMENSNTPSQGLLVGKPDASARVKIIAIKNEGISVTSDEALRKLEVTPGKIGEIIVSGNHVLRNYLDNKPAVERNKIFIGEQCWHRTGDSGFLGANGNLYLTGRCSTLIYLKNEILSPFTYENHFQSIHGVKIGTIVLFEQKLTAVIEMEDYGKKSYIEDQIHSLPQAFALIVFLKKIPRDLRHHSKIDYEKLQNLMKRKYWR